MRVSICIASMGRPSLLQTIASVRRAIQASGAPADIVVADDSSDGAATTLLAGETGIAVAAVASGNVALARNACLDLATGDWLLFVDDDEHVDERWLAEHLRVAAEHCADVVLGPVYHLYPDDTPAWFRAVDPLFQDWGWAQTGRTVSQGRTGNTLVRRAFIEHHGLRFDPQFGRSGGEDHDFFQRLGALGGKMVVTDRAKVWETVPPSRANSAYIMERSVRSGQTHAMVCLRNAGTLGRMGFAVDAGAKLAAALLGSILVAPFSRSGLFRMHIRVASNYGKLLVLAGGRMRSSWA